MLSVNETFDDKYLINKVIGSGGMGTVYLATDLNDNTKWAIKEAEINDSNRNLLMTEVNALRSVSDPVFPAFRSAEEKDGFFYIVMEYINGITLEDILNRDLKIRESQLVDFFRQIAKAFHYLHSLETPIVYRDCKPANIMVESSGRIRIIDLGIAQEYSGDKAIADVAALTRGYAAPEQYDRRYMLDERTDIYSLGVTMHYLTTGKNPNKPPYVFLPVRKLRGEISPALEYIIKKCLQPSPEDRYRNIRELIDDLNNIQNLNNDLIQQEKRKRILLTGVITAVLITAVLISVFLLRKETGRMDEYYMHIEAAEKADSLDDALRELQTAIDSAPDNPEAYIAYARALADYGHPQEAYDYIEETIIPKFNDIYDNSSFMELMQEIELSIQKTAGEK